jgi:hypothetical protein
MRSSSRGFVVVCLLCAAPRLAQAQQSPQFASPIATALTAPVPEPAPAQMPPADPPALHLRDVQVTGTDCSLLSREITAQFQFGFPAGVRLQLPFLGRPNHYTVAEVFLGTEWTVLTATAGLRTIFEFPFQDPHNAFVIGPGVHAIFFDALESSHDTGGGVLVDMTLGWAFDRQAHGCWEFGFDLGLALVAAGHTVLPLPTFGIYGGIHF